MRRLLLSPERGFPTVPPRRSSQPFSKRCGRPQPEEAAAAGPPSRLLTPKQPHLLRRLPLVPHANLWFLDLAVENAGQTAEFEI